MPARAEDAPVSLLNSDNFPAGHFLQIFGVQLEDCVRRPRRRPDGFELQEILIEIRFHVLHVTERRHASDREAGHGSHEIGVCPPDGFAGIFADEFFIHAVGAAGEHEDRFARVLPFEDERLDDLAKVASRAVGGFLCRTRGFGMFDHGVVVSERVEQVLDFLCGRGKICHIPDYNLKIMPVLKVALALLVSLLPINVLRVLGYRALFGYSTADARIGFGTIVAVDEASIEKSKIGMFNLLIGPITVNIRAGASIGNRNSFVCGYWVLRKENKGLNYTRTLDIGADALITSSHYFDLAGTFKLGARSWIAGIGSQFWTHGVGVRERNIEIGEDCYLGSAVRFAPGSSIGNNVLVAMGSVVSSALNVDNALVGGVPARVLKENYDWKTEHER